MSNDEFMKQQFLTLRDEIRDSKARIFWLLIIGIVLVMMAGYLAAWFRHAPRPISTELIAFHQAEQMTRLRNFCRWNATPRKTQAPADGVNL